MIGSGRYIHKGTMSSSLSSRVKPRELESENAKTEEAVTTDEDTFLCTSGPELQEKYNELSRVYQQSIQAQENLKSQLIASTREVCDLKVLINVLEQNIHTSSATLLEEKKKNENLQRENEFLVAENSSSSSRRACNALEEEKIHLISLLRTAKSDSNSKSERIEMFIEKNKDLQNSFHRQSLELEELRRTKSVLAREVSRMREREEMSTSSERKQREKLEESERRFISLQKEFYVACHELLQLKRDNFRAEIEVDLPPPHRVAMARLKTQQHLLSQAEQTISDLEKKVMYGCEEINAQAQRTLVWEQLYSEMKEEMEKLELLLNEHTSPSPSTSHSISREKREEREGTTGLRFSRLFSELCETKILLHVESCRHRRYKGEKEVMSRELSKCKQNHSLVLEEMWELRKKLEELEGSEEQVIARDSLSPLALSSVMLSGLEREREREKLQDEDVDVDVDVHMSAPNTSEKNEVTRLKEELAQVKQALKKERVKVKCMDEMSAKWKEENEEGKLKAMQVSLNPNPIPISNPNTNPNPN